MGEEVERTAGHGQSQWGSKKTIPGGSRGGLHQQGVASLAVEKEKPGGLWNRTAKLQLKN
jgi:hypothetical protein